MKLTDESIMPFGKFKKTGTAMANVPARYLLWLWDKWGSTKPFGEEANAVKDYIADNLDGLRNDNDCDATEIDLY